jgi:hypothetical protein
VSHNVASVTVETVIVVVKMIIVNGEYWFSELEWFFILYLFAVYIRKYMEMGLCQ